MTKAKRQRGRPAIGPRRDMRMSDEHWQQLEAYGNGNASAGFRALMERNRRHLIAVIRARKGKHPIPRTDPPDHSAD